jgi:hypothetical protein
MVNCCHFPANPKIAVYHVVYNWQIKEGDYKYTSYYKSGEYF